MSYKHRILTVFFAFLYMFPGVIGHCQAYTSIVIFGDSLTDVGNDAAVSKSIYGSSAQVPGPATGYTNGRFTDGNDTSPAAQNYNGVWAEQLASMLPAHPTVLNSLAGGNDYAYGFATTNTGTSAFTYGPGNALSFNVNNIGQQVSDYLATHPVITNKTLFIVWGGANDLIAATSTADIVNAAQRDAGIVQRLIAAGATDIIVPNLPPLGLVPRFNGSPATSVPTTQACAGFNQALAAALAALPAANPGVTLHIFPLDTYTLFNTIVGPPIAKGFANVTSSSQGVTTVNPDTYLFWDDLHPTTYGHNQLAVAAFTLIGTPVTTSAAVTSNNAHANLGASVTLIASVTGSSGTPVGTVTFFDGTTSLGSSLVSGSTTVATAVFTTSSLTAGTHSITAQFSGVNGYGSSTSAAFSEVVTAPAISSAFAAPLTLASGSSGTATLTVTPVGGYSGTATFACGTALPAHFTCSILPTSLTLKGDNVQQSVVVTIGTSALAALELPGTPNGPKPNGIVWAFGLPLFGIAGMAALRRRRMGIGRLTLLVLTTVVATGGVTALSGCSSASNNKAAPGTYTVPTTMTVNGTTTTQNLSVIVQ
jgi:phospholipase/lecithinase/hemolysin